MRLIYCSALIFLTLFSPCRSIPFTPRDNFWNEAQLESRSTIAPVQRFNSRPEPFREKPRAPKRRSVDYSVVQVDGSSVGNMPATIVQTVTQSVKAEQLSTATVSMTTVISEPLSIATDIVTTVQEVVTTISTSPPSPAPTVETQNVVSVVTNSVISTVTATLTTSTSYYDDGLWHTYYPVKNFQPDWSTTTSSTWRSSTTSAGSSSTTVYARAATGSSSAPGQARDLVAPEAALSSNAGRASTLNTGNKEKKRQESDDEAIMSTPKHELEPRHAPADLQVASWNITEA